MTTTQLQSKSILLDQYQQLQIYSQAGIYSSNLAFGCLEVEVIPSPPALKWPKQQQKKMKYNALYLLDLSHNVNIY